MDNFDFSGWATKANLKCSDGRVILKDAFKHCDGAKVPLVWNHQHDDVNEVLGHALLENREEGVYAYCKFNETESGKAARELVQHGDIVALSIYANKLKQNGEQVTHGIIREVSLVMAGANPGAFIDSILCHDDGTDEEAVIYTGEELELAHAEEQEETVESEISHADDTKEEKETSKGKSVKEVLSTLNEEQEAAMEYVIGEVLKAAGVELTDEDDSDDEDDKTNVKHNFEGGTEPMKTNVFDQEKVETTGVLTHADQENIIKLAKSNGGMTLKHAIDTYVAENDSLQHGFVDEEGNDAIDTLFPEYKDVKGGAPELVERDLTWVGAVMKGVHKSPISRIRTRFADARSADLRAKGYNDRKNEKTISGNIKLVNRTTDPQTVYRKDTMHRDDIIDITDFDVVEYQYKVMKHNMEEELALAIMIGDGREEGDADKISEEHIRSIWHDDELYTIHADVDIAKAKAELQGSNTSANFGENYIYAEAIIAAALYSREKYKGVGNLEFYCTPHLLNVMLLARDLNGRRIYDSKADLAAALNVKAIHTVEQFEGKTRTTKDGKTKKLLGLFVNLNDYHVGSTKGGELTRFSDFDIDFNQYKYLIETRLSGAMVNLWSAIALEEPVDGGK